MLFKPMVHLLVFDATALPGSPHEGDGGPVKTIICVAERNAEVAFNRAIIHLLERGWSGRLAENARRVRETEIARYPAAMQETLRQALKDGIASVFVRLKGASPPPAGPGAGPSSQSPG